MARLNHRHVARVAYESITLLEWIVLNARDIADRANSDVDDCLSRSSGDHRSGGDTLTHPERHAQTRIAQPDPVAAQMHELLTTLTRARSIAGALTTSRDPRDLEAQRTVATAIHRIGAGPCTNCNTHIPGTATDRLRAGRCEPCYRYWKQHGNERPRHHWHGERGPNAQ